MQLRYALGGGTSKSGHPFTIMSDRQKGLLNAVSKIFPECEQRFCLRHIYANFQFFFRGCFKWQFTGIPCKHANAAIYARHHDHPEDHVSEFFKKPCYQKAYQDIIFPVPGQHDWTKTDTPGIDPPVFTRHPVRKNK